MQQTLFDVLAVLLEGHPSRRGGGGDTQFVRAKKLQKQLSRNPVKGWILTVHFCQTYILARMLNVQCHEISWKNIVSFLMQKQMFPNAS